MPKFLNHPVLLHLQSGPRWQWNSSRFIWLPVKETKFFLMQRKSFGSTGKSRGRSDMAGSSLTMPTVIHFLSLYPVSALSSPCLPVADSLSVSSISSYLLSISACKYSNYQIWLLIPYVFFSRPLKHFQSLLHWWPLLYEFLLKTTSPSILEPAYLRHFSNCCSCLYSKLPVFLSYPFLLPKSLVYKLVSALPLKQWEGKWFEENEAYFL